MDSDSSAAASAPGNPVDRRGQGKGMCGHTGSWDVSEPGRRTVQALDGNRTAPKGYEGGRGEEPQPAAPISAGRIMKQIKTLTQFERTIQIPGSKSFTHRALIAAALAHGESVLEGCLVCEDTIITAEALRSLGTQIKLDGDRARVSGKGGVFTNKPGIGPINMGNSGTSFRFMVSIATLAQGPIILTGSDRMKERPVGYLVDMLNQFGADVRYLGAAGYPPLEIRGPGIRGGKGILPGSQSSQFISSILLTGPYAKEGVEIEITERGVSRPYIDMTIEIMNQFGIHVERDDYVYFKIPTGQQYQPLDYGIEGDASTASYFWAAAAVTGGRVVTQNIHATETSQGDIGLLEIFEAMGCRVERGRSQVTLEGGGLTGVEVDLANMPDMVPTLAAVALFAEGKTIIRNVPHLRHKESDRLRSVATEWAKLGARVEELSDGLIIHGQSPLVGATLDPHNDHRLAMSSAVAGLKIPGIVIENEECVAKSCPGFWDLWDGLYSADRVA